MKKFTTLLALAVCSVTFAQNKFDIHAGLGTLNIKKEQFLNYEIGATYYPATNIGLYLNANYSNTEFKDLYNTKIKSDFTNIQLGAKYNLKSNKITFSPLFGFSLFNTNKTYFIEKKTSLATDLGLEMKYDLNDKFALGVKTVNFFSSHANASISQTNFILLYKL